MYRAIGAAVFALYLAVAFPQKFMSAQEDKSVTAKSAKFEAPSNNRPKKAVGYRGRGGQFSFNAMLNQTHVKVLVDTGASSVAINRTTARRIGIQVDEEDFRHLATTANGKVKYARGTIAELRIDGVKVRNIEAAILPDKALSGTLLGMSFLNKLKSYRFDGNKLTLLQ